jgi:hypothetical protein
MPADPVQPCFRCGAPAELPALGSGHVAGKTEERVPVCVACLVLLLKDAPAFWAGVRQRRDKGQG